MNIDHYGLPVVKIGEVEDGGDTATNFGFYRTMLVFQKWFLSADVTSFPLSTNTDFEKALPLLEPKPGEFVRHPDFPDSKDFSRDQAIGFASGLGFSGYGAPLWRLFSKVVMRFGFYPNKDFMLPHHFIHMVRLLLMSNEVPFLGRIFIYSVWPFIYATEIGIGLALLLHNPKWLLLTFLSSFPYMLFNSFERIIRGRDFNNVGDDKNHILVLLTAYTVFPTFSEFVCRWIYSYFRPGFLVIPHQDNPPEVMKTNAHIGPMWALEWYFRPESGNNPEMAQVSQPVLRKVFWI